MTKRTERAQRTQAKNGAGSAPGHLVRADARRDDDHTPALARVGPCARAVDGWRADLEQRLRAEDDHPVPLSHLAKYRSLMPALALILHVIDGVDTGVGGPVSGVAAEHAAAWCRYLEARSARAARGRAGYSPTTHVYPSDLADPAVGASR
jgi:Protein of unknown function (DUF3987)